MKKEFEYWYPFDFRNSAKDLIQNHLSFCLFNHTAIFPQKYWPKAYVLNGRIMINNEKMSKSKGNFFTARELYTKHGADIVRIAAAHAGEGIDDANYEMEFLETAKRKLTEIHQFIKENYNKGRLNNLLIDQWFESKIHQAIQKSTESLENMLPKSAVQTALSDLHRNLKWYLRRTNQQPQKKLVNLFIETQLKLLVPFTPHFCEECWELIKQEDFITNAPWPQHNLKKIKTQLDLGEELLKNNIKDIREVMKLAQIANPKTIKLFTANKWKYQFIDKFKILLKKTRHPGEILKELMTTNLKKHGKDISKLIPALIRDPSKLPTEKITPNSELKSLEESQSLLQEEFSCPIEILTGQDHPKAKSALPGKVGILVE